MRRICALLFYIPILLSGQALQKKTRVFIITTDGFRWQELFRGADSLLLLKDAGRWSKTKFWADNSEERRELLMPFFWHSVVKQGQLLGNRTLGSSVNVKIVCKIIYATNNKTIILPLRP